MDVLLRFRGLRGTPSATALVIVENLADGAALGTLTHRLRYSPTGLNWGYEGAGARDLARSLLAAALPAATACPDCGGCRSGQAPSCASCVDGLRGDLPEVAFTREVISRLGPTWELTTTDVQTWWDQSGHAPSA